MDEKDKRDYELAFILDDEGRFADVLRLCRQHDLEIKRESQPKKMNLAYKIGKLTQGYFGFLRLHGFAEGAKSLENDLKTTAGVARSIMIRLPKEALEIREPSAAEPRKSPAPQPRKTAAPSAQKPAVEVLSNEALERKIEEILK